MNNQQAITGDGRKEPEKSLDIAARAALVCEAFLVTVAGGLLMLKARCEDAKHCNRSWEQLQEAYFHEMDAFWLEFQAMAANRPDAELHGVLDKYGSAQEAIGLAEWQMVTDRYQKSHAGDDEVPVAPAPDHGIGRRKLSVATVP